MRPHPHLYEINTRPWLDDLSSKAGRPMTLVDVPDGEWDQLRDRGIDIVFLMGVWRRSRFGRELALSSPMLMHAYDRALPGWTPREVAGSAYCIAGYEPDERVGTWDDLATVRTRLHERDMRLIVDFVPNHTGFDHPWVRLHPDRYVHATLQVYRRNPTSFRPVVATDGQMRLVACGRDPYFPPWSDVAQLDYSSPDTRAAMIAELERLSQHVDGARCDMAMLELSDVFGNTWGDCLRAPMPATEFWAEARSAVPGFLLLAEVYWDLEWRLQQLGFDFTYDKRLYDRLLYSTPVDVRGHLTAELEYQRRLARFIENHDEPRSAPAFGERVRAAATACATVPGMRFFYQGQLDGRTDQLPVQLGRWRNEPVDGELVRFYDRLLAAVNHDVYHSGEWRLLEVGRADDGTNDNLLAWRWDQGDEVRIVAVNMGEAVAHGVVRLALPLPGDSANDTVVFEDELSGHHYPWSRRSVNDHGLYVKLESGGAHLLRLAR